MLKSLIPIVLLLLVSASCITRNNTYATTTREVRFNEDGSSDTITKEDDTFFAPNDSIAYISAFTRFCGSVRAYKDMAFNGIAKFGEGPIDFTLRNMSRGGDTVVISPSDSAMGAKLSAIWALNVEAPSAHEKRYMDGIANQAEDSVTLRKLKPYFQSKTDEFDDDATVWIKSKNAPKYVNRNACYAYFGKAGVSITPLYIQVQYYGEDWLFIDRVTFNVDGENYTVYPDKIKRDNDSKVWEWFWFPASRDNSDLLEALSEARNVKMKIYGSKYNKTVTLTQQQITDFKRTIELYNAMKRSPRLKF